jgi:hypothetical protein
VCYKWSTLFSINSPNSPNLPYFGKVEFGEYHEGSHFGELEFGESERFPKKAILASTRIRQNWRISNEYSNLLNSLASGHCLRFDQLLSLHTTASAFSTHLPYTHICRLGGGGGCNCHSSARKVQKREKEIGEGRRYNHGGRIGKRGRQCI